MNKNMNFNYNHPQFGNLVVSITSGENISNKKIIPATLLVKCKNSPMEFLTELYTMYAGKDDKLTDIIANFMVDDSISKLSVQEIGDQISNKYAKIISKNNKKFEQPIKEHDGIYVKIVNPQDQDPLYTADIVVKKINGGLSAYIESQMTKPEFRGQGLMTEALLDLNKYCNTNDIQSISLEPGEIDGISNDNLSKMYQKRGFEKQANGIFVQTVGMTRER